MSVKVATARPAAAPVVYTPVTLTFSDGTTVMLSRVGNIVTGVAMPGTDPGGVLGVQALPVAFSPTGNSVTYEFKSTGAYAAVGNWYFTLAETPAVGVGLGVGIGAGGAAPWGPITASWLADPAPVTTADVTLGTFTLVNGEPTECGLQVYRGDTFVQSFTFEDSVTGNPITLDGTWMAQVRQDVNATAPLATFTVDATQAAAGKVLLSLNGLTTTTLTSGVWDLQRTDANGTVTTWLYGTVSVTPDVTH